MEQFSGIDHNAIYPAINIKIENDISIIEPENMLSPITKQENYTNGYNELNARTVLFPENVQVQKVYTSHKDDTKNSECVNERLTNGFSLPNTKKFACEVCNKLFNSRSNRDKHIRTHTGEKPFVCEICSKRFLQSSSRRSHMATHTLDRPYICKEENCGKDFKRANDLRRHIDMHNARHKCELYDKMFRNNFNLILHMRVHTNERPYSCDICSKTFKLKSALSAHLPSHLDHRPFICDICCKTFKARSALVKHIDTHTEHKPFPCNFCGKFYKQNGTLTRHMKVCAKNSFN